MPLNLRDSMTGAFAVTNTLVLIARLPIIAAASGPESTAQISIEEKRWEQGFMSDEHQPAEADNEAAPVASSDSDSAADMKAILESLPPQ